MRVVRKQTTPRREQPTIAKRMRTLAFVLAVLAPASAAAVGDETDGISLSLELGGHFGAGPDEIDRTDASLDFHTLGPPIDEIAVAFGATVEELASELALRIGYGFASGDTGDVSYSVTRIPLTLSWRAALFGGKLRPLLGVDVGAMWTGVRYEGAFASDAGLGLSFTLRGLVGGDFAVGERSSLRAFLQYRLDPSRTVVGGPNLDADGVAFGLGYVIRLGRPERSDERRDRALRSEGTTSGLDEAFEWIRRGDEAARRGDAVGAERAYAQGIELLPRDQETRENVEAPVRVDWAKQLLEVGRRDEAIEVLLVAKEISLEPKKINRMLRRLGVDPSEEAPTERDDRRMPVVPR